MKIYLILMTTLFIWSSATYARDVSFSWEPMDGALTYEIQVSNSKDFTTPIAAQKLKTPTFSTALNPGKYFYRVRVIDSGNHEGKWSEPAPVNVGSNPPDLLRPAADLQLSYFDRPPEVSFQWKPIDLTAVYEIVIRDSAGTEIFHTTQDKTSYKAVLSKGEYKWQVRSVGKSPIPGRQETEDVPSEFTPERALKVTKNDVTKPILKTPADGAKLVSQSPVIFSWTQDPHTHFADIQIDKLDEEKEKKSPLKFENIKENSYSKKIEIPGHYQWSLLAKEDATSPGIESDTRQFTILDDPLFAGNYELEASLAYLNDVYLTNSSLQNLSPTQINQQSTSYGMQYGLSGGYYVFRSLGFFISIKEAPLSLENASTTQNELDGTLRLRYGANGFFQEFWFGYRKMDILEAENSPTSNTIDFVTTGPLVGSRISAEVIHLKRIRAGCRPALQGGAGDRGVGDRSAQKSRTHRALYRTDGLLQRGKTGIQPL